MDGGDGFFDQLWYMETYFDKSAKKGIVLDVASGTVKNSWGGNGT